jgi:hypothetical protein
MSSSRAADVINSLQLALARTPSDLEQRHQAFIQLYNTTAHQGLLSAQRLPPIPVEILGAAQGRCYPQEVLAEKFAHALFPRTTNRYGCVTLHSYHFFYRGRYPQEPGLALGLGGAVARRLGQCGPRRIVLSV